MSQSTARGFHSTSLTLNNRHEDRDKALRLCGLYFERDTNALLKFTERLEREQAYTRAAAIAVFNLNFHMAVDVLKHGSDTDSSLLGVIFNFIGLAIAGFSNKKDSLWRKYVNIRRTKGTDPYLRAIFSFLTTEDSNYDEILVSFIRYVRLNTT